MRDRAKNSALRIIGLASKLPRDRVGDVMGRQVLKSGTSLGADCAEALRASSKRQFIAILTATGRTANRRK
jgi:four helix bundle protein